MAHLAAAAALALAAVAVPGAPGALAGRAAPTAVVAVVDTGVNPYHAEFRDRSARARRHPSTYLRGFPPSAVALRLSLDAPSFEAALARDCERVWSKVRRGQLYWFPGTKIVGAIAFEGGAEVECGGSQVRVPLLDRSGHGTMTASRAAANTFGACPECRLVAVQGLQADSLRWAAGNAGWIDVQSNSWGAYLPGWNPAPGAVPPPLGGNDPAFVRLVEDAARRQPLFWAAGNGVGTRYGVLGHPTVVDPRLTPSSLVVGGHDSGYVTTWPGFPPHLVADACGGWSAKRDHMAETDQSGSGTSAAAPFAAGAGARLLVEARRLLGDARTGARDGVLAAGRAGRVASGPLADGELTRAEWRDLLLASASPRPAGQPSDGATCRLSAGNTVYGTTPVRWADVPPEYPEHVQIGYGATDAAAFARACAVLRGAAPLPDRAVTDAYFAADAAARAALHGVFAGR